MRKSKTLRKLLEKIRGFKTGDYVKYKLEEKTVWYYGVIDDMTIDRQTMLIRRKGKDWLDLVLPLVDEVHLARKRKKYERE